MRAVPDCQVGRTSTQMLAHNHRTAATAALVVSVLRDGVHLSQIQILDVNGDAIKHRPLRTRWLRWWWSELVMQPLDLPEYAILLLFLTAAVVIAIVFVSSPLSCLSSLYFDAASISVNQHVIDGADRSGDGFRQCACSSD